MSLGIKEFGRSTVVCKIFTIDEFYRKISPSISVQCFELCEGAPKGKRKRNALNIGVITKTMSAQCQESFRLVPV